MNLAADNSDVKNHVSRYRRAKAIAFQAANSSDWDKHENQWAAKGRRAVRQ
jgi:hypothetical protein